MMAVVVCVLAPAVYTVLSLAGVVPMTVPVLLGWLAWLQLVHVAAGIVLWRRRAGLYTRVTSENRPARRSPASAPGSRSQCRLVGSARSSRKRSPPASRFAPAAPLAAGLGWSGYGGLSLRRILGHRAHHPGHAAGGGRRAVRRR